MNLKFILKSKHKFYNKLGLGLMLFLGLSLFGCNKSDEDEPAKPVVQTETIENAQKICNADLAWLLDIIKKAEEDKANLKHKAQYIGSIHLYSYKGETVFYLFMPLGSGSALGHVRTCDNRDIFPEAVNGVIDFPRKAMTEGKLLYTNLPG
jgi:hypothetical protein